MQVFVPLRSFLISSPAQDVVARICKATGQEPSPEMSITFWDFVNFLLVRPRPRCVTAEPRAVLLVSG